MTIETHITNVDRIRTYEVVLAGNCHTVIEFYELGGNLIHTINVFNWDRSDFPIHSYEHVENKP